MTRAPWDAGNEGDREIVRVCVAWGVETLWISLQSSLDLSRMTRSSEHRIEGDERAVLHQLSESVR